MSYGYFSWYLSSLKSALDHFQSWNSKSDPRDSWNSKSEWPKRFFSYKSYCPCFYLKRSLPIYLQLKTTVTFPNKIACIVSPWLMHFLRPVPIFAYWVICWSPLTNCKKYSREAQSISIEENIHSAWMEMVGISKYTFTYICPWYKS